VLSKVHVLEVRKLIDQLVGLAINPVNEYSLLSMYILVLDPTKCN